MSYALNSVNNVAAGSNANVDLGLSTLIAAPNDFEVLGIDASGNAKALTGATQVGTMGLSYVTQSGGWGGTITITDGYQFRLRSASCQIEQDNSLVTRHTVGSAGFIIGWTVVTGNYLFILNHAVDTSAGGDCNAQLYNVATSAHVGPKIHFKTGNFSSTLTYYASVSSNTRFELRALDVNGTCTFLNSTSMFSCTINIFKV